MITAHQLAQITITTDPLERKGANKRFYHRRMQSSSWGEIFEGKVAEEMVSLKPKGLFTGIV